MRKVFAHWTHSYEDRARHILYVTPGGRWREMPDEIAEMLLQAHPTKLCDVTGDTNPDAHTCVITEVRAAFEASQPVQEPPETIRLSPQNRRKLRAAKKRSKVARLKYAEV